MKPIKQVPTLSMVDLIPLAEAGVYELSDREVEKTRRLLYGINKDGIRKFRTTREGPLLMVWRIK